MELPHLEVIRVPPGTSDAEVIRKIALTATGDQDHPLVRMADVGITVEQFRRLVLIFSGVELIFPSHNVTQRAWTDVAIWVDCRRKDAEAVAAKRNVPLTRVERALTRVRPE